MADITNEPKLSVSTKSPKSPKTITITLPKLPRPRVKHLITKGRVFFLVLTLLIGLGGGVLGGWIEHSNYQGALLNATTGNNEIHVSNYNSLVSTIAQKLDPSVVSINATTTTQGSNFFGYTQPIQSQSAGTGIIISSNGLVLTNRHVVPAGTTSLSITLSNGTVLNNVSVVGRTASTDSLDIAILRINNAQGQTLVPATLGDSSQMQVGDGVIAIGNALGQFQNTVTSGIISGFGRNIQASSGGGSNIFGFNSSTNSENLTDMFQTDAAINEGNSGGPLVNLNGQVIGVNTAIASNSQNIGFAIPINEVKGLIKEVITTGKFERPLLGVRFELLTPELAKQNNLSVNSGAYIPKNNNSSTPSVVAGSAAAKAGVKPGDVITQVDGISVNQKNDLTMIIDQYEPGSKVTLTVVRGAKTLTLHATLGKLS